MEFYLRDLLAAQRDLGLQVSLLSGSQEMRPQVQVEEDQVDGVQVLRLHRDDLHFDHYAKLYHPEVSQKVEELLRRLRPDLIHVHQWIRLTCNLVEIAHGLGIPAVVTLHDVYTSCPRCFRMHRGGQTCFLPLSVANCLGCVPRFGHESEMEVQEGIQLFQDQYQAELALAQRVLVANVATAELLAQCNDMAPESLQVLPLPYAPKFRQKLHPYQLPPGDQPFRFAYWGSVTRHKGVHVLLQAFKDLLQPKLPRPVELHVFGKPDTPALAKELGNLAKGLPVTLHGSYEPADLQAAGLHMAVFPMLCFETYGFVLDECFELGLPCMVSEMGALPLRAGGAALKFAPDNPGAITQTMAEVLAKPELCVDLVAQIQPLSPSPKSHAQQLQDVYAAACAADLVKGVSKVDPARHQRLIMLQRESLHWRMGPDLQPE